MTWESMTDRERDAWIAENVMGWTLLDRRAMGWGDGPPVFRTGEDPEDPHSSPTRQEPKFTTEPADDYLVLEHVREKWKEPVYVFMDSLNAIWNDKLHNGEWGDQEPWSCYEPGDYSHAAFLALEESE